jgi:flagellar hook-associated protein FlgK
MTEKNIQLRLSQINSRIKSLERINDEYMTSHGEMNEAVYNKIQELHDERDMLYTELQKEEQLA